MWANIWSMHVYHWLNRYCQLAIRKKTLHICHLNNLWPIKLARGQIDHYTSLTWLYLTQMPHCHPQTVFTGDQQPLPPSCSTSWQAKRDPLTVLMPFAVCSIPHSHVPLSHCQYLSRFNRARSSFHAGQARGLVSFGPAKLSSGIWTWAPAESISSCGGAQGWLWSSTMVVQAGARSASRRTKR